MPPWVLRVTTQLMSLRSLRRDKDAETEAAGGIWRHQHPRETGGTGWDWAALARWGASTGDRDISIVQFGSPDQKQPPVSSLRENCLWPPRSAPASLTQVKWKLGLELDTRMFYPELSPAMRWHLDQGQKMYNMQMFSQQFSDKFSDQYGECHSILILTFWRDRRKSQCNIV